MRITFEPQYRNETLTLRRSGEKLIINEDVTLDFSNLDEGASGKFEESPTDYLLPNPVRRVNGVVELTLIRPCPPIQLAPFDPITLEDGETVTLNKPESFNEIV